MRVHEIGTLQPSLVGGPVSGGQKELLTGPTRVGEPPPSSSCKARQIAEVDRDPGTGKKNLQAAAIQLLTDGGSLSTFGGSLLKTNRSLPPGEPL